MNAALVKKGSNKGLCHLYDAATQNYRALKAAKTDSLEMVLTVILQQCVAYCTQTSLDIDCKLPVEQSFASSIDDMCLACKK